MKEQFKNSRYVTNPIAGAPLISTTRTVTLTKELFYNFRKCSLICKIPKNIGAALVLHKIHGHRHKKNVHAKSIPITTKYTMLTKSLPLLGLVDVLLRVGAGGVPQQVQVVVHEVRLLQGHPLVALLAGCSPAVLLAAAHLGHLEHAAPLAGRHGRRRRRGPVLPEDASGQGWPRRRARGLLGQGRRALGQARGGAGLTGSAEELVEAVEGGLRGDAVVVAVEVERVAALHGG